MIAMIRVEERATEEQVMARVWRKGKQRVRNGKQDRRGNTTEEKGGRTRWGEKMNR